MINFRLTFLLAFKLKQLTPDSAKLKKRSRTKPLISKLKLSKAKTKLKIHKSISSKRSSRRSTNSKRESKKSTKNLPNLIVPGAILGSIHTEFTLLPSKRKIQLDVVCHERVAKVHCGKEKLAYRVLQINGTAWVAVHLQQCFEPLDDLQMEDVIRYHVVKCPIITNKRKLSSAAKLNKCKQYFCHLKDVEHTGIVQVFETNPEDVPIIKTREEDVTYKCPVLEDETRATTAKSEQCKELFCRAKTAESTITKSSTGKKDTFHDDVKDNKKDDKQYNNLVLKDCYHRYMIVRIIRGDDSIYYKDCNKFPQRTMMNEDVDSDQEFTEVFNAYKNAGSLYKDYRAKHSTRKKGSKKGSKLSKESAGIDKKSTTSKISKSSKASKKSRKTVKKKGKKERKSEKKSIVFNVSGETFVTNPDLCIYKITNSNSKVTLDTAYMLLTVEDFLSEENKKLRPFIINVRKLINVPVETLEKYGFEKLYFSYNLPQFNISCVSKEKEIEHTIRFDEAHVCFISKLMELEVQEFVQTRKMIIKIMGIRNKQFLEDYTSTLFGTESSDPNIAIVRDPSDYIRSLQKPKVLLHELLGVACVDFEMHFLNNHIHQVELAELRHPNNVMFQKYETVYCEKPLNNPITCNEVNLNQSILKRNDTNPCCDSLFLNCRTALKVETRLAEQVHFLSGIQTSNEVFRRGVFIIKDEEVARQMLHLIFLNNQSCLGSQVVVLPNYAQPRFTDYSDPVNVEALPTEAQLNVITGFVIDNFASFLFYIETRSNELLNIYHELCKYTDLVVFKFFNSNLIFERRLYTEFLNYGGFYVITMYRPLQELLKRQDVYLRGNLPVPCFEALSKLDLVFKSNAIEAIMRNNLLPTAKQLLSLDLEFGVPHRISQSVRY